MQLNVLIAAEQPLHREGLTALLTRASNGCEITQTDRFAKVISALSADSAIEMAIVDLTLPGLNEIAGIRNLRTHFPHVRIMVTAASLHRDSIVDCLRAGVHGIIAKSLSSGEILEALETVANGRIYVPAIISDDLEETYSPESPRPLSERQREVLFVLAAGKSNKEIARQLGITEGTVKVHVNAVFRTLGVHNRLGAIAAFRSVEKSSGPFEPALPGMLPQFQRAKGRSRREP